MKVEAIEFEVNEQTLRGKIFWPESSKNLAILFLHGWTGKPNEPAAKKIAENGISAMIISLSGHNDSDGTMEGQSRQRSLQEVLATYDYFKNRLPEETKIGVAGNSYGGYFAAILTSLRPVSCLQMRVPANYPNEGFDAPVRGHAFSDIMQWRQQKLDSQATRSLQALHSFKCPVQIIEAEHDDAIPHQVVLNYIESISNKSQIDYHFMKGWPHSLGEDKERNHQYQTILLQWLEKQL